MRVAATIVCVSTQSAMNRSLSLQNLFLSHTWAADLRGRSTHERVALLNRELRARGWKVWFDEDKLLVGEPLDVQLASGISQSDAVVICVTKRYCEKVNAAMAGDNVYKEWNFCQAIGKKMIPLIFEAEMLDVKAWPHGAMAMVLGNTFYLDASGDDMADVAARLSQMLQILGLRSRLTTSQSWPRVLSPTRKLDKKLRMRRIRTEVRI